MAGHGKAVYPATSWDVLTKITPLIEHRGIRQCYPWKGSRNGKGYPQIGIGKTYLPVHRIVYAVTHADEPGSLLVRHLCGNTWCLNPNHLAAGTHRDNQHDTIAAGRHPHGDRSGTRKLSEAEALAIRAKYADGICQRALAIEYGIARRSVAHIVNGRTWGHLGGPVQRNREPSVSVAIAQSAVAEVARAVNPTERQRIDAGTGILTAKQAADIKRLRAKGVRRHALADAYGVGVNAIIDIDMGRTFTYAHPSSPSAEREMTGGEAS